MDRRAVLKNLSVGSVAPFLREPFQSNLRNTERKLQSFRMQMVLSRLILWKNSVTWQKIAVSNPLNYSIPQNGISYSAGDFRSLYPMVALSVLRKDGMTPTCISNCRNDLLEIIPKAADKGIPQIIVFSGNRNGLPDHQGIEYCAQGLDPVIKVAERYNVRIIMELLNSKINHVDYQCDHTPWGLELVDKIGSTHFKLLYDIYHMQIMEGDVIRTITDHKDYIAHFIPGVYRAGMKLMRSQELYYPAIMNAIVANGFEWICSTGIYSHRRVIR